MIVAFTANDRPHYLVEALCTWREVRGIKNAHFIFRCEPGNPDVVRICESVDFVRRVDVIVNPERYGALHNPWKCFESGFANGTDFVVLAEDDSLVSTDVLEFFTWSQISFRKRREALAVCAFRHRSAGPASAVSLSGRFRPTIWGTWIDRWRDVLRDDWDHTYTHKGWDWRIQEKWIRDEGLRVVKPCQSRSQVSGQYGGTHLLPEMYASHLSDCFTADIPQQQYVETA